MKNSSVQKSFFAFLFSILGLLVFPGCSREEDVLNEMGLATEERGRLDHVTAEGVAQANGPAIQEILSDEPRASLGWVLNETRVEVPAAYFGDPRLPISGQKIAMFEILQTVAISNRTGEVIAGANALYIKSILDQSMKFSYRLSYSGQEMNWETKGLALVHSGEEIKVGELENFRDFITKGEFKVEILDLVIIEDAADDGVVK